MARKYQRLINYHSSGNDLPIPYDVHYGEIAVIHNPDSPKLVIKVGDDTLRIFQSYDGKVIKTAEAFTALTSANTDYIIDAAFLKDYITEDEEVIAAALNDLNERTINNASAITEIESTVEGGFADIDERLEAVENVVDGIPEIVDDRDEFLAIDVDGEDKLVTANIIKDIIEENEYTTAAALNDLDERVTELSEKDVLEGRIVTDEETFRDLSGDTTGLLVDAGLVSRIIIDDEYVISTAYNDHNTRIEELEAAVDDIQNDSGLTDTTNTAGQHINNTSTTYPIVATDATNRDYGETVKVTNISFANGIVNASGYKVNGTDIADIYQTKGGYLSASTNYAASSSVGGAASNSEKLGNRAASDYSLTSHTHSIYALTADTYTKAQVDELISSATSEIDIEDVAGLQEALDGKSDTGHTHDDRYFTETEVTNMLSNYLLKADSGHNHDDRYYTETEVNNILSDYLLKSESAHTHAASDIVGAPLGGFVLVSDNTNKTGMWISPDQLTVGTANTLSGYSASDFMRSGTIDGGTF